MPQNIFKPSEIFDISSIMKDNVLSKNAIYTYTDIFKFDEKNLDSKIIYFDNLDKILDFYENDLVIVCQSGIKIYDLNNFLANYNLSFYYNDYDKNQNVGNLRLIDFIMKNDTGVIESSNRLFNQSILGLDVILPCGTIVNCGGKVVKNVTGYDITKLFIGSYNSLAIPVNVNLRLSSRRTNSETVCLCFDSGEFLFEILNFIYHANLKPIVWQVFNKKDKIFTGKLPDAAKFNYSMIIQFDNFEDKFAQLIQNKFSEHKYFLYDISDELTDVLLKLNQLHFNIDNDNQIIVNMSLKNSINLIEKFSNVQFVLSPSQNKIKFVNLSSNELLDLYSAIKLYGDTILEIRYNGKITVVYTDKINAEYNLFKSYKQKFDPDLVLNSNIKCQKSYE